ncbi:ubiquitin fusion degradation protein UFD1-domain-containing protein [Limtongia smithiae]|uniref:ubiquitin fusion degradation protein UFD1-domain-containing protein n=1 Tax=Limtongia smithiae TaxID=1125753 RepID=UPI0034CFEFF8
MASAQSHSSPYTVTLAVQISPVLAYSDRVLLPQTVLERLVARVGRDPLPSPLTFQVFNPATGATTHCGVREFSAPENVVVVSAQTALSLGISERQLVAVDDAETTPVLIITPQQLPKGTFVRLRPLEAEYLTIDDDWKALLESALQASYTTLTEGLTFAILNPSTQTPLTFLVDKLEPASAVCIIETDLTVDIETMSEDFARKSVAAVASKRRAEREGVELLTLNTPLTGFFPADHNKNGLFYAQLDVWDRSKPIEFKLDILDTADDIGPDIDDRVADVFVSVDDKPSSTYFLWSTATDEKNTFQIAPSNSFFASAEHLTFAVQNASTSPLPFSFTVSQTLLPSAEEDPHIANTDLSLTQCRNCKKFFPVRSIQLHSAFCERNNILCPYDGCGRIFRRQDGISESHWHCADCVSAGSYFSCDSPATQEKHIAMHHTPVNCQCGVRFSTAIQLAQHRATDCALKLHLCRFCHLRVPRETPSESQSDLLAGYTGHESRCGTRTTECPKCDRIVRLRDIDHHIQLHELQRVSAPTPTVCANSMCMHVLDGDLIYNNNPLGLCASCYSPLHSPMHDPTGARLKARIERRYLIQLTTGCKRPYCVNSVCATGRTMLSQPKLAPVEVTGLVKELVGGGKLEFCVDDSMTRKRQLVDWIADDREFMRAWICKAVEQVGGVSDGDDIRQSEDTVRTWLKENGVRLAETV